MRSGQAGHTPHRSLLKRSVRILLKAILTLLVIILLMVILIQTPYIQNIIRARAVKYLAGKLQTRVEIGSLRIRFPNTVLLGGIYLEDRQRDTLLSAGLIHIDMDMWALLHSHIDVRELDLDNIVVHVDRQLPDTVFNFQFIADAFAGKEPAVPKAKDTASGMKISFGTLGLHNIHLLYRDTVTGNDDEIHIDNSVTRMEAFDPDRGIFHVAEFRTKGLQARIRQTKPLPPSASSRAASHPERTASPLQLNLGKIDLEDTRLDYGNTVTALFAFLRSDRLAANIQTFDPANNRFVVSDLEIDSTDARLDNDKQPRQKRGVDYAHLDVTRLTLHGSNLIYDGDSISGRITEGRFDERSGFVLDRLETVFLYANKRASLRDLYLLTPGTLLRRNLAISYSSVGAIATDPVHTLVDVDLRNSRVQVRDILSFAPSLQGQRAFSHPSTTWQINSRITGSLDALRIQNLQISGIEDLRVDLMGSVRHPLNTKKIAADLDIRNISGSKDGLAALLPPNTLPASIGIPQTFDLRGKVRGGMDSARADLVLQTSSGSVAIRGVGRQFRDLNRLSYDAYLRTDSLDLGHILRDNQQWGRVTAGFSVDGKGIDVHTANAKLKGTIRSAVIKQYDYRDVKFDASIVDQHMELKTSVDNTAIRFDLNGSADLSSKYPALKLDWQIDTIDLHALHFVTDTLRFHGHLTADFASTDPDSMRGNLKLFDLALTSGQRHLVTDSILLLAQRDAGLEDIRFSSEMADIDLHGRFRITEIAPAIRQAIDKYYRMSPVSSDARAITSRPKTSATRSDSVSFASISRPGASVPGPASANPMAAQDWQMTMHLRPSPLALALMPSLKGTDSVGAQVAFKSEHSDLSVVLNAPRIQVGGQRFYRTGLRVATTDSALTYELDLGGARGSGFAFHHTSIRGRLANGRLYSSVLLKDDKGKDRYRIAGELQRIGDAQKLVLSPDSLLLNYDKWDVSRDNYVQYGPGGLVVNDLRISDKQESLQINSRSASPTAPIDVAFTNFRLSTLSRFAEQDSSLADGLLNGKAEVKNVLKTPLFTSDLRIQGLIVKRDSVGDLVIKVNNEKANAYTADISLRGHQNDVEVKGDYYSGESRMDLKLALNNLNLASARPFVTSQMQDMRGSLKGSLALTGNFDKPGINGRLHFDSALIVPVLTGEPLKLSSDNIEFDNEGFNFSQFAFQDSSGNKATLDGNVYTTDYKDFDVDVTFNAHNFRLVNAQEASNREFYGKMNLDAAVSVQGDPVDSLNVDGNLRINRNTNFVFVLPQRDPEVVNRQGVVRFVDHAHPQDTLVDMAALALASRQSQIKGFDISLAVETDSSAIFTMIIDERNGDILTTRGRSNLVFGMDKSGKTDLTGAYEIESGAYNLSLDVLKRKFLIQRGSTITWTGDPTSATLDLTADYTANTPSIDLIENEIAGRPQDQINKFKQKLPFLVTLKMQGDLLKPVITFDISLPTDVLTLWPDVDQKLQQIRVDQSELNKQVFALLLLNRFVGENPLESVAGGGSSLGNMAFQSASQILTNQLDQLAGSLIKGVDIHFDLNNQQDFSTGTEQDYTELNVSVSKQLFNERIQVSVGSDFDVQGTGNPNQNASNIAGDVAVDYKLTQDGRYLLRAYRKNQYEAVVEGEVVETGVSFILTFDYDRFLEIFGRTREEKLADRQRAKASGKTNPNKTVPVNGTTPGNNNPSPASPSTPSPPPNPVGNPNPPGNGSSQNKPATP